MRPLFAPSFIGEKKSCIARPQRRRVEPSPPTAISCSRQASSRSSVSRLSSEERRCERACIVYPPSEREFFCYSGEHKNVKTLMFACLNNTLSRRSDLLYSSHSLSPRQGHLGRWTLPPPRSLDVEEEKIRLGLGKRLLCRLPHTFTNRARELKPEI